jgi:hypothetical protein
MKKNSRFYILNCDLFIPRHPWRMSKVQKSLQTTKREHPAHQNVQFPHLKRPKPKRIRIYNTVLECTDFRCCTWTTGTPNPCRPANCTSCRPSTALYRCSPYAVVSTSGLTCQVPYRYPVPIIFDIKNYRNDKLIPFQTETVSRSVPDPNPYVFGPPGSFPFLIKVLSWLKCWLQNKILIQKFPCKKFNFKQQTNYYNIEAFKLNFLSTKNMKILILFASSKSQKFLVRIRIRIR